MKLNLFLSVWLYSLFVVAQQTGNIDVNNVKAGINPDGILFKDQSSYHSAFEVPAGSNLHAFRYGSLWLAAKDDSGAVLAFGPPFAMDEAYLAGPVAGNFFGRDYQDRYEQVWKINRHVIDFHRENWNTPGYNVPREIADWPGNGNTNNDEALLLAPFFDFDGNQQYDPEAGDYPCIRGDQAIYAIYKDYVRSSLDFGFPTGVEVHLMAYEFAEKEQLSNTVFLNYKIINRTALDLHDAFVGSYMDGDIGCREDDYVGCDTNLNAFFFYNGDNFDEACPGSGGYGSSPPACGVMFLEEKMTSFIEYDRSYAFNGFPTGAEDIYHYLQGRWRSGFPVTYGGNGLGGTMPVKYMYPGVPGDASQWSKAASPVSESHGLGATGPFSLMAGDTIELDLAVVWARSPDATDFASVSALKNAMMEVQALYDQLYGGQLSVCDFATGVAERHEDPEAAVFPNPVEGRLHFSFGLNKPLSIQVIDILGKEVVPTQPVVEGLDTDRWSSGIYFVVFDWGKKRTVEKISVR